MLKYIKESKSKKSYKAEIYVDVYEDVYTIGQGDNVNSYNYILKSDTLDGLINKLYDKLDIEKSDLKYDNINNYDWASELWCSKLIDENERTPDKSDISMYKNNSYMLYRANYHILLSIVGEIPINIKEFERLGIK